ncbi:MAG TPA: SlyX family protein [Woeseiaceae bacterium]|nr:SlyX family protein [Woeseiaceae bacterium]
MNEQRLIDIEVKLAHHEQALEEVNQVLTDQHARLSRLERVCESLVEKFRALSEAPARDERDEPRPPHY